MISRLWAVAVLMAALPALAGCGRVGGADGRPTVVAAFYPLQFVTEQIAGGHVRVVTLTAPGIEPHDLDLRPSQVAEISGADLVVYEKGLQPAVDDAVAQNADGRGLDVSTHVDLTGKNPHFWLDPLRLAKAADVVEARLAKADPTHEGDFSANLRTLTSTLQGLDQEYRAGLSHCRRNLVVTSHDAFGYQAKYGLRFAPIAGLSPDAEPSPARIAELRSLVEQEHVTTVFSETLASPKMAETLSRDLGIEAAVLDPIEGVAEGRTVDYVSIMRSNLAALQKADGCEVAP